MSEDDKLQLCEFDESFLADIDCIVHLRTRYKKICRKCEMHYCIEFYESTCPDPNNTEGIYHPAKVNPELLRA